jgi:hypothetical protein
MIYWRLGYTLSRSRGVVSNTSPVADVVWIGPRAFCAACRLAGGGRSGRSRSVASEITMGQPVLLRARRCVVYLQPL